jgi:putative transcriptional regulator
LRREEPGAELRTASPLSQAALGAALGVSRQTILDRERYLPSLPLAIDIARHFDTTVEQVFQPDGEEQR